MLRVVKDPSTRQKITALIIKFQPENPVIDRITETHPDLKEELDAHRNGISEAIRKVLG